MFTGNLHSDTTEENLYKLFGLRSTQYLKQNCLVNILLINKTGKIKGFTFIVTPEKLHQDLVKLDGTDSFGRKILIKEAISTRKKDLKQTNRPNFVVNNFTEHQDLFKRPRIVPDNKLYATAISELEVEATYHKRNYSRQPPRKQIFVIGDSHLTRIKKDSLRKNSKEIRYILDVLVEQILNRCIIM